VPKVRFARDSLLEGQGFEPSVPSRGQHFLRPPRNRDTAIVGPPLSGGEASELDAMIHDRPRRVFGPIVGKARITTFPVLLARLS
jgi:hypothetical protein